MRKVVDITDLTVWHGNLSGIQRVVYEMAVRYAHQPNVEFCYFVEEDRRFYRLGDIDILLHPPATDSSAGSSAVVDVKKFTSRIASNIKRGIKVVVPPIVSKLAVYSRGRFHNFVKQHEGADHVAQAGDIPFNFVDGDILIVYGAHWDKPHYIAALQNLKKEYKIRLVHNINDFIPVYDKAHTAEVEHERFPLYMRAVCELSDMLFFISQATRRDYERFISDFNIRNLPYTKVLTLGEDYSQTQPVKPKDISNEPFILNVGTLEVRKNPVLLYQVYRRASELGVELPKLYIVGRMGWLSGDIYYQLVHDERVNKKVVIRHDIDDSGLAWMYKNCEFFVFPSYYEGWGLPVAEAAHYGKASAASSSSSIPEVVGDGAAYFSPYSVDECLKVISKMLDQKTRASHEHRLKERAPNTWSATYAAADSMIDGVFNQKF